MSWTKRFLHNCRRQATRVPTRPSESSEHHFTKKIKKKSEGYEHPSNERAAAVCVCVCVWKSSKTTGAWAPTNHSSKPDGCAVLNDCSNKVQSLFLGDQSGQLRIQPFIATSRRLVLVESSNCCRQSRGGNPVWFGGVVTSLSLFFFFFELFWCSCSCR